MAGIFERASLKGMSLPNRFVRSATWEGMAATDGSCTKRLIDLMVQLAKGGVGLIISGHTYISPEGQAGPRHLLIHDDRFIPGLLEMTTAVHKAGGKIVLQIGHAGSQSDVELTGQQPMAPSSLFVESKGYFCRAMTIQDIRMVVNAFGQAALRAQKAGFDGIQIHAAHGYLLSEFLSPFFNKREDEYGGDIEDRTRIVREVLQSIRKCVGPDLPVLFKLNSSDFLTGGQDIEGMLATASILEKDGADAVELSGGTLFSGRNNPMRKGKIESEEDEVFYLDAARRYKESISMPLMLVGGIRSLSVSEHLVADNLADYVSLSRPLIREPGLINRWKSGDTCKAECQSDNLCYKAAQSGEGVHCVVEKRRKDRGPEGPS
ncbi:MAG: NADH:flavin oxidoreductase [Desulforhabdus sp.]|jgi:2,4-dienoyl-CoA reductase-like NADH-dependent reductase (Old Yellow Enzyme family)|nr:NADH:flavin oxidoreductase [Desulforhabdus sp.]